MPSALRLAILRARIASGLPQRGRGGQPGNANRLVHGRYSRRFLLRRQRVQGLLRSARAAIVELNAASRSFRLRRNGDKSRLACARLEGSNALRAHAMMAPWPS